MDDNTRVVYTHTGTESLRGQEQRESTTGSMSGGLSLEPSAPTPHASGSSFASRHSRAAAAAASSTSESTPVLVAPPLGPSSTLSSTAAESRGSSSLPSAVATSSAGGQPRLDAMVANASEPVLRSSIAPVTTIATDTSNLPNVHEERQFPPLQAAVATSSAAEIEATLPPGVGASTTSSNTTYTRLVDPAGPPPSRVSALTVAALAAQIRTPLTYESALATLLVRELQESEPLLATQTNNHELSLALLAVPDDGAFRALVQLSAQELSSLVTKLVRHARRAVATIARDEAGSRSEPEHILQASRRLWAVVQQELQIEQSVAEVLRIVVHHRGVGTDAGAAHSIVSYALSEGLFEADACAAAVLTCGSAYEFQAVLDDSVQGAQYPNQLELLYRVSLEVLSGEGRPDDLDECVRRIRTLFLDTLRAGPPAPSYVDYPQSLSGCDVAASTVPLRGSVRQGAHEVSTQDSTLRSAIRPTNNGSTPRQLTFDSAFTRVPRAGIPTSLTGVVRTPAHERAAVTESISAAVEDIILRSRADVQPSMHRLLRVCQTAGVSPISALVMLQEVSESRIDISTSRVVSAASNLIQRDLVAPLDAMREAIAAHTPRAPNFGNASSVAASAAVQSTRSVRHAERSDFGTAPASWGAAANRQATMGDEGGTVTSSLRGVRPDELFNIDPDATEEDLIRIRAMAADRPGLFRHAARGGENGTATSSQRGARYDEFCEPVHEEEGGAPFTSTYSRPHTSSAPPHTSSYSRPYSSSPTHESTRDKGHPHTPPASGPPFEVSARTLSTIVWYPCALVPGRSCNSMRDPPDIEDVLALAPTSVQELKIEPFEMVSTFNGYLNIDPESDSAMIDWATSRPLLLRDMLHMVVWQLGRGKSLRVSEQLVLQGICKCIIGCGKLITVVSKAQVSRLQSGVVGHGVDSAPGVNIEATIQLVDAALISSNEFIQSKDWDTFSWTEGSPNKMLARLIELSFNHELDFTALRKKFVQVVTVARSAGLIQRVGDPLHNEFVSRIHTYTSVVDLRDRLREHTVGDLPLRWQEPQNPRYRNRQGEANSNEGDGGDYSGYYPAEGGYGAYHPGGGNESLGRGGDRFTGGAGRFSGRGKGDGRGKGKGGDRPAGLIQPLKNMERIGRECSHLFGGKRPGPLVNPEGDGQYGLACWCCCMMQYGYEVEMSFGDYFRAHGTAPVGKYSTRPKPRNMVITHPEPMCPNAPYILRAEAGEDPAKQWMIETDPRDPFIEALEVALREKGKPPYRTPRDRPPRQPDRQ